MIDKLQKVQEALESCKWKTVDGCDHRVFDELLVKEALAELKEFMEGEAKKPSIIRAKCNCGRLVPFDMRDL